MPLAPRDLNPGLHHVWVNATGHWDYYLDDSDRIGWVALLVRTLRAYGWTCSAFAQLTTHVHLLVSVPDSSLGAGMQYLNREYGKDFNARQERAGQLTRRRYGSRRVVDGDDLLGVFVYVVLNPVEAGLCGHPEDWHWSSYATTIGLSNAFPFVDASLVIAEAGSPKALRRLVEAERARRMSRTAMSGI